MTTLEFLLIVCCLISVSAYIYVDTRAKTVSAVEQFMTRKTGVPSDDQLIEIMHSRL